MSWKEKLKKSQGGEHKSFPKLDIGLRLDVKHEAGKTLFHYYDKNSDPKDKYIKQSITGILLGKCMRLGVFDPEFGKNGGSYYSSEYFTNKKITLFSPAGKLCLTGTREEIEKWLINEGVRDRVSSKQVIHVLVLKNNEPTLVEITTSLVLAIDQFKKYGDIFSSNLIKLIPTKYDPETTDISDNAKKIMGKFALKNPPNYASIHIDETSIDEVAEAYKLDSIMDAYIEWQEFKTDFNTRESDEKAEAEKELEDAMGLHAAANAGDDPDDITSGDDNEEDDLPW